MLNLVSPLLFGFALLGLSACEQPVLVNESSSASDSSSQSKITDDALPAELFENQIGYTANSSFVIGDKIVQTGNSPHLPASHMHKVNFGTLNNLNQFVISGHDQEMSDTGAYNYSSYDYTPDNIGGFFYESRVQPRVTISPTVFTKRQSYKRIKADGKLDQNFNINFELRNSAYQDNFGWIGTSPIVVDRDNCTSPGCRDHLYLFGAFDHVNGLPIDFPAVKINRASGAFTVLSAPVIETCTDALGTNCTTAQNWRKGILPTGYQINVRKIDYGPYIFPDYYKFSMNQNATYLTILVPEGRTIKINNQLINQRFVFFDLLLGQILDYRLEIERSENVLVGYEPQVLIDTDDDGIADTPYDPPIYDRQWFPIDSSYLTNSIEISNANISPNQAQGIIVKGNSENAIRARITSNSGLASDYLYSHSDSLNENGMLYQVGTGIRSNDCNSLTPVGLLQKKCFGINLQFGTLTFETNSNLAMENLNFTESFIYRGQPWPASHAVSKYTRSLVTFERVVSGDYYELKVKNCFFDLLSKCSTYALDVNTGLFDRKPTSAQTSAQFLSSVNYSINKNFLWVWGLKKEFSDRLFIQKYDLQTNQKVHEGQILLEKINRADMIFSDNNAHIESLGLNLYINEILVTNPETSERSILSFETNGSISGFQKVLSKLLVTGNFTEVNGLPSNGLFLVDPSDGNITRNLNVLENTTFRYADNPESGCVLNVPAPQIYTYKTIGNRIFINGDFDRVGGQTRYGIAALREDLSLDPFNPLPPSFNPVAPAFDPYTCTVSGLGGTQMSFTGGYLTGPNNETIVTGSSRLLNSSGGGLSGSFLLNASTGQQLGLLALDFTFDTSKILAEKYIVIQNSISNFSFFDTVANVYRTTWSLPTSQMNPNDETIFEQKFEVFKNYLIVTNTVAPDSTVKKVVIFETSNLGVRFFKDLSNLVPAQTDQVDLTCQFSGSGSLEPCVKTEVKIINDSLVINTESSLKSYSLSAVGLK